MNNISNRANIRGRIFDDTGEPLPGATVTLSGAKLKGKLSAITNSKGNFAFLSILPDIYKISACLEGFQTVVIIDTIVESGETKEISLEMNIATVSECITVTGEIPGPAEEEIEYNKDSDEDFYLAEEEIPDILTLNEKLDEEVDQLSVGRILFNIPKKMKVSIKERVEVRISQNINEDLTKRLKGRGFPQVEEITVSTEMKVKLHGETFKIESLSEEKQFTSSTGYTLWEWDVTPLKSGNRLIHLSVAILINLEKYGEKTKSLPVMEKEIYVKVHLKYSFLNFIRKHWRWIIGIIGTIIGLYFTYKGLTK